MDPRHDGCRPDDLWVVANRQGALPPIERQLEDNREVARRDDRDDFLFRTAHGRFALVHRSYSAVPSTEWPHTTVYDTFAECLRSPVVRLLVSGRRLRQLRVVLVM